MIDLTFENVFQRQFLTIGKPAKIKQKSNPFQVERIKEQEEQ